MSLELDIFRFTTHAATFSDAWVQLCKWPFSWAGEKASDWTKYPIALGVVFFIVWLVAFLLSLSEYSLWSTCVALWVLSSIVVVFINWKDGNMK